MTWPQTLGLGDRHAVPSQGRHAFEETRLLISLQIRLASGGLQRDSRHATPDASRRRRGIRPQLRRSVSSDLPEAGDGRSAGSAGPLVSWPVEAWPVASESKRSIVLSDPTVARPERIGRGQALMNRGSGQDDPHLAVGSQPRRNYT
jgi:hypothetical protein